MKNVSAVALCCLWASSVFAADQKDVEGTWKLASATRKIVDTNEVIDAYGGPRPNGWINYGKDGRMMVICAYEGRQKPEANDKMTDEDRVRLHKSFFAYAGTYKLEGNKIIHSIDTSWNEVWSGTQQIREIDYKDNKVTLTTLPFKFNVDGKMSVITLVWERYAQ